DRCRRFPRAAREVLLRQQQIRRARDGPPNASRRFQGLRQWLSRCTSNENDFMECRMRAGQGATNGARYARRISRAAATYPSYDAARKAQECIASVEVGGARWSESQRRCARLAAVPCRRAEN